MFRNSIRLVVSALIGLAVCWHVMGVGDRSLWFDEAFSWRLIGFPWTEMIARAQQDVHPPLYYVVLRLWTGLLGDSVLAMRLLSVIWFGVALSMAYLLCREADIPSAGSPQNKETQEHRDAALFAVLLLAAGPLLYRYHQEARMYAQEVALVLTSNWLLLRSLRASESRGRWWIGYAIAATSLCYTHYFGLFSVAAQVVFTAGVLVCTPRSDVRSGDRTRILPQWFWAATSALLLAALYLPWLPTLLQQQARVTTDYWSKSISVASPISLSFWRTVAFHSFAYAPDQTTASLTADGVSSMVGNGLLLAVWVVMLMLASLRTRVGWLLLAGVVIPLFLSLAVCYKSNRNLIEPRFLIPSFALLLVGLALILSRLELAPVRWLAFGLICSGLAYGTWRYIDALGRPVRSEYRGVADCIAGELRRGDLVLCTSHASFFPMLYHARGRFPVYQAQYPELGVGHYTGGPIFQSEDFRDWEDVVRSGGHRLWIVGPRTTHRALRIPDSWKRLESVDFPEAIHWLGDIALELWEPYDMQEHPPQESTPSHEGSHRTL
jgi:mannosyltransferase